MKPYYYLIDLKKYKDDRGALVPLELNNNCPFDIKRAFYIYDVPSDNISRGEHANLDTQLLLIAVSGNVTIEVKYENKEEVFILDSPDKALFLDKGIYKRMYNFSKNAVLLCLSDCYYNPAGYV